MRIRIALYFVASLCTAGYPAFSRADSSLSTHCKQDEFAYLNARMASIRYFNNRNHEKGYELLKNGKVLSICADRQSEPLTLITYRYGVVGKVEIEIKGTVANKVGLFERSTSPHTGENILFFRAGDFTYYVTEATAQGSGIGLNVYSEGKRVAHLFSGNDRGKDYESGLFVINFYKASSPIFVHREPPDPVPW